ncbi:MAG TPA: hypothetical protein VH583_01645 [Vicinamibacterales bacterium]
MGFGLHEALDQIGATVGPLLLKVAVAQSEGYRRGFPVLLIPALAALTILSDAWRLYPHPRDLEIDEVQLGAGRLPEGELRVPFRKRLGRCRDADCPLLAFHFGQAATISLAWIPALYALAIGVDALAALFFGRFFDRFGIAHRPLWSTSS